MVYKIVLTPDAERQLDDAVTYYKKVVSTKVAKLFLQDYKKTYMDILKTKYFQFFFEDFRGVPMKKFPYIIFYTIDENQKIIIIKAVFHTSQNPEKYREI
ncbi:type II toxin-antitoxin system RelE/ParE family toxin [Chryseobacterium gotjawalense]|uniref:Type II toxin-antitoxin system RelE/ParE family toxin n=1 Tax=Chryseobacterium gotjawalense TaxID=3042315 RepID=A0ABY8RE93_9FLAO|nr:type II toxin-antitoxin system RelE/ParE family toxin [Chryseobacterium sp. wdc7]WHF51552.1 type II toxin-antitoxin system RelE/ParE family toxin [Chryseobacterium sp. wdc7]